MLAELCQITSILSNVCIFLGVSWLAIKYFQFKKILYNIIKMATDQIDQFLQDAVQDATLANITADSQPAGHALFTARSFFLSTEREYFIQFPKIFEIFRMGKPTLNRFLRKPAYVGTLFHT